ncbi:MAG: cbb3-type cytochrome oxidase assembly protein CcoS [Flavobacteriales bacterium]|nr:cbb3-type cytochrome oxidase assembly protein CcoS [Flavobacteriales bacterium]
MSVIIILISISLVFALGFLMAFIWAMNDRQFEDDHTPAVRMLFDSLPSKGKPETGDRKSEKSEEAPISSAAPCLNPLTAKDQQRTANSFS